MERRSWQLLPSASATKDITMNLGWETLQQPVCSLDIFLLWIIRLFLIDATRVIQYPFPISRWNTNMTWRRLALVVDTMDSIKVVTWFKIIENNGVYLDRKNWLYFLFNKFSISLKNLDYSFFYLVENS